MWASSIGRISGFHPEERGFDSPCPYQPLGNEMGKGDRNRTIDFRKYWDAPYWNRHSKDNKSKRSTSISSDNDSICRDCAKEKGGVWPEGHVATQWYGNCDYCHKRKACCSIGDWNWPNVDFSVRRD